MAHSGYLLGLQSGNVLRLKTHWSLLHDENLPTEDAQLCYFLFDTEQKITLGLGLVCLSVLKQMWKFNATNLTGNNCHFQSLLLASAIRENKMIDEYFESQNFVFYETWTRAQATHLQVIGALRKPLHPQATFSKVDKTQRTNVAWIFWTK